MNRLLVATLIALPLMLAATRSDAQPTNYDACASTSSGGYCYGNFLSFQSDPNSSYVAFYENGGAGFLANFHGTYSSCNVSYSNTSLLSQWHDAINARGYFYVSWDSSGTCTQLTLENHTQYQSY